jgi:hypothetical protein
MDIEDLNRIKSRSPSGGSGKGPWISDENEMRRKTIVKRILKMYCDDPATQRALELDGGEFEEEPTAATRTQDRLNVPFNGGGLAEGEISHTSTPNGLPAADDPQPSGKTGGKIASQELLDEIYADIGTQNLTPDQVQALLKSVGAASLTSATEEQARAILKLLAESRTE